MFVIDYKDRRPIYEQIIDRMKDLIFRGVLPEDSQLPSVRNLAVDLSINPNTIQRAYAELERQGFTYSVKGRGSFVSCVTQMKEQKQKEIFLELEHLIDQAKTVPISLSEFEEQVIRCYGHGIVGERSEGSKESEKI